MTTIKQADFIQSIENALQFISYYHPKDFIDAMTLAWQKEQSVAAKDAIAQILVNSRMCAEGHRPICQDTGIVTVFLEMGMNLHWDAVMSIEDMVNEAVRRAYKSADNPLRASIVADPAGKRQNTGDNTPAVIHMKTVPGNKLSVIVAAKGGGSENKARFTVLNPGSNIADWIEQQVITMGAGWCPPGILGIGIGGTAEKAMLLAKEALLEPVDIQQLIDREPVSAIEELRLEIYHRINKLGIGAQGLGGLTTVLDVKILDYPTHAASKPVAIIPNCAATRHIHINLDGSGPAYPEPPDINDWPKISWDPSGSRKVDLNSLTKADIQDWQPGETLLLSGNLLTGRDAAHKRIIDTLNKGESLPQGLDFTNRFIYYVGPVDPVNNEVVGPAGPTTATRMDIFTDAMLEQTGLIGMIGKAERGPEAIKTIKKHQAVYLIATGGAAYLVSKAIQASKVIAYPELGMEAVYEFKIKDMPVTVAVDSRGKSVHLTGPAHWRQQLAGINIV
ncbi:MAG: fumarate hydratase [Gammaproteobacteria bacterium]